MLAKSDPPILPAICAWNLFLHGVVDDFKTRGIPEFVSHDKLPKVAPEVRSRMLTSLRALTLISASGQVQPHFRRIVEARNTDSWQTSLRLLMQSAYPFLKAVILVRADSAELRAAFLQHIRRDTANVSKCEAFYLNLAREAGVPLSEALKKRVATSDSMATVRAARKDIKPSKVETMKPETPKPAMSKQERVDKIMDILRMFSNEGLPAEQLAALLCLWDYAKKTAEAE
jgi:hypothetical protein